MVRHGRYLPAGSAYVDPSTHLFERRVLHRHPVWSVRVGAVAVLSHRMPFKVTDPCPGDGGTFGWVGCWNRQYAAL